MTRNDIIRMAKEAGLYFKDDDMICEWLDELRCFTQLVRADEREACAKVCDEASDKALALQSGRQDDLGSVILRHHAVAHQSDAAVIRARGQA